jgi:hypothetical protein
VQEQKQSLFRSIAGLSGEAAAQEAKKLTLTVVKEEG